MASWQVVEISDPHTAACLDLQINLILLQWNSSEHELDLEQIKAVQCLNALEGEIMHALFLESTSVGFPGVSALLLKGNPLVDEALAAFVHDYPQVQVHDYQGLRNLDETIQLSCKLRRSHGSQSPNHTQ